MPKPDPLELLKAIRKKEVVDKPVFRLSKPGRNSPLKMQSGQESEFAKAHNSSDVVSGSTQAPPDAEEDMRAKHLSKIQNIASGLPSKKPIPNYDNIVLSKKKAEEVEAAKFMNEESRFKNILPDPRLERSKRAKMWDYDLTEDEAIDMMDSENEFEGLKDDRSLELVDDALNRLGYTKHFDAKTGKIRMLPPKKGGGYQQGITIQNRKEDEE